MARIPLLTHREELDSERQAVFDSVVETRGSMIRPYEVLLHTPGIAGAAAKLGHQIRYQGQLSDHDRELAIITTSQVHDCEFEWTSHVDIARSAGVAEGTITALKSGAGNIAPDDQMIVDFVRELCANSNVSDETFDEIEVAIGTSRVIELSALVGYYTFLGYAMKVAGAC
ncbi:carboxymuconolactone decarboxylase family protein [uncultured Ilumatobacter sp.]|jgi:4-carboxymuconolactone decarboxylase|uniref:carboxymuconolactone decarboxylase family protein n=1 Tax=uncultured Ilumatobacter sp. TaxID=879968 RepID=UPI00374EDBAF|tara:strand:+ start:531 stop:1043 length:513 start_codon:yes stop_codon:yes gene_type:complete